MSEHPHALDRRVSPARRASLELRVAHIETQVSANAELILDIHKDLALTKEIHAWLEKGRGFFAVCGWLAGALKWLAALIIPIAAVWAIIWGKNTGGGPP